MTATLSSRERMLAAVNGETPDHVPCCFMLFRALQQRCRDQAEFVQRQLELGLDACVELPAHPNPRHETVTDHGDMHTL